MKRLQRMKDLPNLVEQVFHSYIREGAKMYRVAICDDDERQCFYIEDIVLQYAKEVHEIIAVDVFFSGDRLYEKVKSGEYYDFIFLDIELGEPNGIDVGRRIREELDNNYVQIIYISSYKQYMEELFQIRPMGFLPKPLSGKMIQDALITGIRLSGQRYRMFTYKIGRDYFKLPVKDILYFKGMRREVLMVTEKEQIRFYGSLRRTYEDVCRDYFVMTGKSYIVNYKYIVSFTPRELRLVNGITLPVGKGKYAELVNIQNQWEKNKMFEYGEM